MKKVLENLDQLKQAPAGTLFMIFFGGCGEFGMNMTGYYIDKRLYLVDCGLVFSEPYHLGVEAAVPQVDRWIKHLGGVAAYLLTHGHEDHIGAMPFFIKKWPAPIYCTRWTDRLLEDKFERHGIDNATHQRFVISAGDRINLEQLSVEWVHMNHSIPMTCALVLRTKKTNVFHTGDFKLEKKPRGEAPANLEQLSALGKEGIDILVADSTNATHTGFSPEEETVRSPLSRHIKEAKGRVFFSTFASNLWRLRTVIDVCLKQNRKIAISGAGVKKTLKIANDLGLVPDFSKIYVEESSLKQHHPKKLLTILSGCQGEYRSALWRLVNGEHSSFQLEHGDTLVLSSRIIPGNEKSVYNIMSECARLGVQVISAKSDPSIHVSGHAYQGELKELLRRLRPRFYIPVHGTHLQLGANRELVTKFGNMESVSVETGTVLKTGQRVTNVGHIEVERAFVDSWSNKPLSQVELRERLKIGDSGLVIVSGIYQKKRHKWLAPLDLQTFGLARKEEVTAEEWQSEMKSVVETALTAALSKEGLKDEQVNDAVRLALRRRISSYLVKKPVVAVKVFLV